MQDETAAQIEVRVQPRAKRNAIEAVAGGPVKAYVTAPPEGGKANEAVVALLAKALSVAKGRVTIVRGHRSRTKLVKIDGLTEKDMLLRLSAVSKVPAPPRGRVRPVSPRRAAFGGLSEAERKGGIRPMRGPAG